MAIFLKTSDVYRLWQRELPEDVYPDGAASGSFSAASVYAKSQLTANLYANMQVIYNNIFPQTANEQQLEWEVKLFGYTLNPSLTLLERQNIVISKIRRKPGITIADMIFLVQSVIGTDKDVAIGEWQNESGQWLIGVSKLGVSTIFGSGLLLAFTTENMPGLNLCSATATSLGVSQTDFNNMLATSFTYSVLIYSYTPTATELSQINLLLTNGEPARSTHVIYSGLDPQFHI